MKLRSLVASILLLTLSNSVLSISNYQIAWVEDWDQNNNIYTIGFSPVQSLDNGYLNFILNPETFQITIDPETPTQIGYKALIKRNIDQSKNIIRQVLNKDNDPNWSRYTGFIPEVNGKLLMDLAYVFYDASYDLVQCTLRGKIKFFREDSEAQSFFDAQGGSSQYKRLYTRDGEIVDKENQNGSGTWIDTHMIKFVTTDDWFCDE